MIFIILSFVNLLLLFVVDQIEIWFLRKHLKKWQDLYEELSDTHKHIEVVGKSTLEYSLEAAKNADYWKQEYYKLAYQYLTQITSKKLTDHA